MTEWTEWADQAPTVDDHRATARVDAVLASLAAARGPPPVDEHVAVFEPPHAALRLNDAGSPASRALTTRP